MDKLAKVREWIQTRKLCTMDEHMNFYCKEAESDYNMLSRIEEVIDSMQEEPVSEELKVELEKYIKDHFTIDTEQLDRFSIEEKDYMYSMDKSDMLALVEHFTNWQKEQFEKNRIAHCETLTDEQAQIESDFVAKHLKDNNRTPTFIDAIEYGMRLHKEQMMKGAKSGIGNYDNYIKFEDGTWIDLDPSEQLKPAFNVNEGDKVKVIVIKED